MVIKWTDTDDKRLLLLILKQNPRVSIDYAQLAQDWPGTENLTTDAVKNRLRKLRADTGITISINGGGRSGPAAAAPRARAAAAAGPPATPLNNTTSYASGSTPNSTTTLGVTSNSNIATNGASAASSDLPATQPAKPRRGKKSAHITIKTEPVDTPNTIPTAIATTASTQVGTPSTDSSGSDVPSSALGPEMMTEVVSPFVTPTKYPSGLRSTTSTAVGDPATAATSTGTNSAGSQANIEAQSTGTKRKRQRSEAPSPSTGKKFVANGAVTTVDGLEENDGDTIVVDTTPPTTSSSTATYAEVASASTTTEKNTNKATDANGGKDQDSPAAKRQCLTNTAATLPRRSKTPTPVRPTRNAATNTVNSTNANKAKTWTDGPDSDSEGEDRWPGKRYKDLESDGDDGEWEMGESSDEMVEEEYEEGYGEGEGEGESEESEESDKSGVKEVVVRSGRGGAGKTGP